MPKKPTKAKKGRKKGFTCPRPANAPHPNPNRPKGKKEAIEAVRKQAADRTLAPGAVVEYRYVDPLDYQRWAKSREERKKKRVILDPLRYGN